MKNQILIKVILICILLFVTKAVYAQTDSFGSVDNEDFSKGQRWLTWALNTLPVPGIGSYTVMHDKVGGTTQLIMGITSQILMTTGFVYVYMSGAYDFSTLSSGNNNGNVDEQKEMIGNIIMAVGEVLSTVNFIYNIVRSATYHKPQSKITTLNDPTAWSIAVLPARNGNIGKVQLSYTIRF